MVLIKGQNYDITNQQKTFLNSDVYSGTTKIFVDNIVGFSANDYIVMNPFNEVTEVLKISSVTANEITLAAGIQFNYSKNDKVYKTPYNQIKFYSSATTNGTFTVRGTVNAMFDQLFTELEYAAGTVDLFYRVTFYNEQTTTETDIDASVSFQITIDDTYVTPEQMLIYLQFANGIIEIADLKEIIKLGEIKLDLDISSSNINILTFGSFLISKHMILNALAAKAVSTGYITATVEGRTVTKSHTELKKDAESALIEYDNFLIANVRSEVARTNFMDEISDDSRKLIIDLMTGAQDSLDFENAYYYSYGIRGRRR